MCKIYNDTVHNTFHAGGLYAFQSNGWSEILERLVGSVVLENPKEPVFQVPGDHVTADTSVLQPCTDMASINSCQLDKHLQFQSEGHMYFYKGVQVGCSVTKQHQAKNSCIVMVLALHSAISD